MDNPEYQSQRNPAGTPVSQPIINAPGVVLILIGLFAVIHLGRQWLGDDLQQWLTLVLAFSPARIAPPAELVGVLFPGGDGAKIWTFFTHMFLHADWMHLIVNSVWMLAFGSVVARRLGTLRFLCFSLFCAAAGAMASQLIYWGTVSLMVGASGAVSGQMAGAIRLMFSQGSPALQLNGGLDPAIRPLTLVETLQHKRALTFIAVWMVVNIIFGMTGFGGSQDIGRIAWEAHAGGFVAGLALFGLFDRRNVS